jgi:hypothetical protein
MGNKSDIQLSDYRFNIGLKDNLFNTPELDAPKESKKPAGN